MGDTTDLMQAAQTPAEARAFVEAFAQLTVHFIRDALAAPFVEVADTQSDLQPDWDDPARLAESGLRVDQIDQPTRAGKRYLHIDVAALPAGKEARSRFLSLTGLSDKLQKTLFPLLRSRAPQNRAELGQEVIRLNAWLDDVRAETFDPTAFVLYQRGIGVHGQTQNLTGAIGAAGAAIAFIDAIRRWSPDAIIDTVGILPPDDVRSPQQIYAWRKAGEDRIVKALLLSNGRAVVFASSKDANIFQPLDTPFKTAKDALARFNDVAKDQRARSQKLHEFVVGEVKTATDKANLHERMGLASRETKTELKTDRFLMMAVLNPDILGGGVQKRLLNNRDLTRFSHVFNLHHCWGWDGGRERNQAHWEQFCEDVKEWCGL